MGRKPPRKTMVLGKPGAGKSTLLECLALALADPAKRSLPMGEGAAGVAPGFRAGS
ncbi:MAG: hypothetical protein R2762_01115 [Bryobacteraceae bacterium]